VVPLLLVACENTVNDASSQVNPDQGTAAPAGENATGSGEGSSAGNDSGLDIEVRLYPSDDVVNQGSQTISFGFPLPPGALVNTSEIVILDETGQELSAYVRSLADWNQLPPQSMRCEQFNAGVEPGIRSALIQFEGEFTDSSVKHYRVRLNQTRQLDTVAEVDVLSTLRQVNDGTYSGHNLVFQVHEPKVHAVIDPEYLSCTNLTPLSGEANKVSDMAATDQAQNDFFYTSIQEFFDRPVSNYTFDIFTDNIRYAYWLYDRPQTFLNAYIRSGNIDQLREGLRAADQFSHEIYTQEECDAINILPEYDCVGFFKIKNKNIGNYYKDSKYSYNENLVTAYLLTGNPRYLDVIPLPTVAVMKLDFDNHGVSTKPAATERHRGNALLDNPAL
jgi:hypothetical protein